jgi:hypothetical protein
MNKEQQPNSPKIRSLFSLSVSCTPSRLQCGIRKHLPTVYDDFFVPTTTSMMVSLIRPAWGMATARNANVAPKMVAGGAPLNSRMRIRDIFSTKMISSGGNEEMVNTKQSRTSAHPSARH